MKLTLVVLAAMIAVAWGAGCTSTSQDCAHLNLSCKHGETVACVDNTCQCAHVHGKRQTDACDSAQWCMDNGNTCQHGDPYCDMGECKCHGDNHHHQPSHHP